MSLSLRYIAPALIALSTTTTYAQDDSSKTQQQQPQRSKKLNISVGIGALTTPEYLGSSEQELYVIPFATLDYKINETDSLFVNPIRGIGGQRKFNDKLTAGITGNIRTSRDAEDADLLTGMADVDTTLELGPFVEYKFNPAFTLGANLLLDTLDAHQSYTASLYSRYRLASPIKKLRLTLSSALTYYGEDFADTYYSVKTSEAIAGRPAYEAQASLGELSVGINGMYFIDNNWFVNTSLGYKHLLGDAADSPLAEEDGNYTAVLAVGYKF